jgi:hypothetical protein
MPGGLIQLVNKGAQDQLVTGQPSFTHFRSMYKRHTEFAMEHFVLNFRGTNLDLLPQSSRILRAKVDRNAQLVHDSYIFLNLPDIYSPVRSIQSTTLGIPFTGSRAVGYEFQWIPNLGYNMIKSVSLLINGTAIVTHTGEWMKLYSYITHNENKRKIIDRMVGNVPELTDPANAYGRFNQYPHSITKVPSDVSKTGAPSILGRQLVIPLHFWFCEDIGSSLPLVALQYSEVEIVVEFRSIYELFTVKDVDPLSKTFGKRIRPDLANPLYSMTRFLSPPSYFATIPINLSLTTWALTPYIESTYIFLSDSEMKEFAKSDTSFLIKDLRPVQKDGIYGPANDIELTMTNLCTRIVWTTQRSDIISNNGFDNYINWLNNKPQIILDGVVESNLTKIYSSGVIQGTNISQKDSLVDTTLIFDGANREQTKPKAFYDLLQNYKHHTGYPLEGIYTYSFALDHHTKQPSGHANGSMFNKTILRVSTQDPPITGLTGTNATTCILKSTAFNRNPTIVNPNLRTADGKLVYSSEDVVTITTSTSPESRPYTYTVVAHVESYNFLRITRGIANVVFSS